MAGTISLLKQVEKVVNEERNVKTREDYQNNDNSTADFAISGDSLEKGEDYQQIQLDLSSNHHELSLCNSFLTEEMKIGARSVLQHSIKSEERDFAISALVKNIQGHEMNIFDEATAISKLIRYYGLTQEDAAQKLGRAQSTIANKLRLLRLTNNERDLILLNKLTERHARSLLKLASPEDRMIILEKIINNNLNVESTENMIENFIGKQRERNNYKKRSKILQNVSSFVNTVNRAVESLKANGILANSKKVKGEDYIEFRVRIPIKQQ